MREVGGCTVCTVKKDAIIVLRCHNLTLSLKYVLTEFWALPSRIRMLPNLSTYCDGVTLHLAMSPIFTAHKSANPKIYTRKMLEMRKELLLVNDDLFQQAQTIDLSDLTLPKLSFWASGIQNR